MRINIILFALFVIINLLADYYIYCVMRRRINRKWVKPVGIISAAINPVLLLIIFLMPLHRGANSTFVAFQWLLLVFISIYVAKYLFCLFDLSARIPQLFKKKRYKPLTITGVVISLVTFVAMWWGALFNRFNIDIEHVDISISDLPEKFEGYKIVQISDLHLGSYDSDTTFVSQLVSKINSLKPDLILFTGDIVNRRSEEIVPFVPILNRLQADDGQFAVLGNHDYAAYYSDNLIEREADRQRLVDYYRQTAFTLLNDSTVMIARDGDSIAVIGVENIGRPPFQSYGSLTKAYRTPADSITKILLSHNPAHWLDSIAENDDNNIALTLSGHTHASQIKIGRISPSAIFHPDAWAGLYANSTGNKQLYINIGIGTVGLPMRIGATPEITLFTLHRK